MERLSLLCVLFFVFACGDDGSSSTNGGTGGMGGGQDGSEAGEMADAAAGSSGSSAGADAAVAEDAALSDIEPGVDCMTACEIMVEPDCENGPPSVSLCVTLCDSQLDGNNEMCRMAFEEFLACLDPTVEASCNEEDDVVTSRCQDENEALDPCLPG